MTSGPAIPSRSRGSVDPPRVTLVVAMRKRRPDRALPRLDRRPGLPSAGSRCSSSTGSRRRFRRSRPSLHPGPSRVGLRSTREGSRPAAWNLGIEAASARSRDREFGHAELGPGLRAGRGRGLGLDRADMSAGRAGYRRGGHRIRDRARTSTPFRRRRRPPPLPDRAGRATPCSLAAPAARPGCANRSTRSSSATGRRAQLPLLATGAGIVWTPRIEARTGAGPSPACGDSTWLRLWEVRVIRPIRARSPPASRPGDARDHARRWRLLGTVSRRARRIAALELACTRPRPPPRDAYAIVPTDVDRGACCRLTRRPPLIRHRHAARHLDARAFSRHTVAQVPGHPDHGAVARREG